MLSSFNRCFSSLGNFLLSSMSLMISASLSTLSSLWCRREFKTWYFDVRREVGVDFFSLLPDTYAVTESQRSRTCGLAMTPTCVPAKPCVSPLVCWTIPSISRKQLAWFHSKQRSTSNPSNTHTRKEHSFKSANSMVPLWTLESWR